MAAKTDVCLDTSAIIALLDKSDSHHPLYRRLFANPPSLVMSALVVAESHAWFLRRYDERRASGLFEFLRTLPSLAILPWDQRAIAQAEAITRKFADQPLTLADAHGLAIIREHRLSRCWSTDRHLSLTGATRPA